MMFLPLDRVCDCMFRSTVFPIVKPSDGKSDGPGVFLSFYCVSILMPTVLLIKKLFDLNCVAMI